MPRRGSCASAAPASSTPASVRAARIVDTSHCRELWVTDAVLADLAVRDDVEVVERDLALHTPDGALAPFI